MDLINQLGRAQQAAFEFETEVEAFGDSHSTPEQVREAWDDVNRQLIALSGLLVKTAQDYTATRVVTLGESEPDDRR
jgi:hypothetical protein